ncbi:MAG TPA: Hsp20/alpha crystallin family protein [Flavobacteriaceae bacterium]|nr:Hsp20/alpha crystallin family protein [Flavobacteriaceae bacterium]MCB9212384.1 Hsp20/alpha crystallin family protein [Alteromonas sp.]HPF11660.1 Hsp20/alpha crystallin family protein [Flavobacteriaceae bacterium]HQU20135.1 Hsp20/alpha crystallin family protein [Flavobacteriaceae bacterium]HQU64776.1 Hsp20/alpha crystallin family protein [Flavobacteriaceae bacterium]
MKLVKKNNAWLPSIFDEFFPENRLDAINYERFSIPAVNISENFANFVVELAVPGLNKENITVEVEKDILKVSSCVSNEGETIENQDGTKFTRKEFNYTAFERSFTLPETVSKDSIKANYENGVLRIELPKVEEAQNIKRMVEIS